MEQSLLGILITLFFFWCNRIICVINIWWVKWEQGRGQKILRVWSVKEGKLPPKSIPFLDKKCDCVYYKKYLLSPCWGTFFRKAFFQAFVWKICMFFPIQMFESWLSLDLKFSREDTSKLQEKTEELFGRKFYLWILLTHSKGVNWKWDK